MYTTSFEARESGLPKRVPCRVLPVLIVLLALVSLSHSAPIPTRTSGSIHLGVGVSSLRQAEVGLFNLYLPWNEERYGFYTKGKGFNALFLTRDHQGGGFEVAAASYEALFPGILIFGSGFSARPGESLLPLHLMSLLNGEVGFRSPWVTLGIVNGIHPFFTRWWYHDSGIRLGVGKEFEVGVTVFEQDRFRPSSVNYGIKLDIQLYPDF